MNSIDNVIQKCCKNKSKNSCKDIKFFTQFIVEECVKIPEQKLDVEEVVSAIVDTKIVSLNVIDTPKGTSYEGQYVSGKKIAVEIKLMQKIMYISNKKDQSVHVVENSLLQSAYVVVPKLINGSKPEDLIKCNYLRPKIVVENVMAEKIDGRNIFKNIIMFLEFKLVSSYLLCYSENHDCNKSSIYLTYKDGTNKKEIICIKGYKILDVQWSLCGQKVAYICGNKDSSVLFVSNIKGNYTYRVTDRELFKYVSGFSWCKDANTILFTSFLKNDKNIFSIDLNTLKWKQLTYGEYKCISKKPKTSFKDKYIAYIRCVNDKSELYIMKKNGLGTEKITNLDSVKDFSWENNSLRIAVLCHNGCESKKDYCLGNEKSGNEIFLVNIKDKCNICLNISKFNLKMKKVKFSPNNKYISFIGKSLDIEDVYFYDVLKNEVVNITENKCSTNISDYEWKLDSSNIYYSYRAENCYNVYLICIYDKKKVQISNSTANNIKICYRPKIV